MFELNLTIHLFLTNLHVTESYPRKNYFPQKIKFKLRLTYLDFLSSNGKDRDIPKVATHLDHLSNHLLETYMDICSDLKPNEIAAIDMLLTL